MTPETQNAINFLDGWLAKVVYNQPCVRAKVPSNPQENMYDCGIWAIKNAVAYMRANTRVVDQLCTALREVAVDLGDRAYYVEQIYAMLLKSKKPEQATVVTDRTETPEQKQVRLASGQLAGIGH
jgi:hypothetical protein